MSGFLIFVLGGMVGFAFGMTVVSNMIDEKIKRVKTLNELKKWWK